MHNLIKRPASMCFVWIESRSWASPCAAPGTVWARNAKGTGGWVEDSCVWNVMV